MVARRAGVASGLAEAARVFALAGASAETRVADATRFEAGQVLLVVHGPVRSILRAERTALNLVQRMSGIATLTATVQERVRAAGPHAKVAATRKTTPGLRALEKRAVAHGGGDPHRFGLYDAVLVKDNHRAAYGDVGALVAKLRRTHPGVLIEVEVEDEKDARAAAQAGADVLLLDNLGPAGCAALSRVLRAEFPRVLLEASGGITPDTAAQYAPHVDRISLGALTQNAPAIDVGLDWG